MRFLFNDAEALDLTLTLVLSVIHLGNQNSAEKDKMRSGVRVLMESFLGYTIDRFSVMRGQAAEMGDRAIDSTPVDELCSRDYYDLKMNHDLKYRIISNDGDQVMA